MKVKVFKVRVRVVLEENVWNAETPILDLSNSGTNLVVFGNDAANLLNRFFSSTFGKIFLALVIYASSMFHHVGVTLWRAEDGYQLFLLHGFSLSLFE